MENIGLGKFLDLQDEKRKANTILIATSAVSSSSEIWNGGMGAKEFYTV